MSSNRVENMLLGVAIGDAFGVGYEAKDKDWIRENVNFEKYQSFRKGKYATGYFLGDYSDDTADTVAVMRTMMNYPEFNEKNLLGEMYIEWLESAWARDGSPRAGYGSVQKFFKGEWTIEEVRGFQSGKNLPGNAPPMRSVPLGLLKDPREIERHAKVVADVTHPHPKAWAASIAVARATYWLTRQYGDHEDAVVCPASYIRHIDEEFYNYLSVVETLPPELNDAQFEFLCGTQPIQSYIEDEPSYKGVSGDAMHTVGAALYILKHTRDPFDALKKSILMGGDVDSLAAITVGISAGRCGLDSIPLGLIGFLENVDYLREVALDFQEYLRK